VYRDGEAWVARIDLAVGADGKRRQVKRRYRTKTEATKALRALRAEAEQVTDWQASRRTVEQAVESFKQVRSISRAAKTIEMEDWRLGLIVSGVGKRQIGKLTVGDCDSFLSKAADGEYGRRPLSPDAVRRVRRLLINVLKNEMRTGGLARNVADLSVLPNMDLRAEIDEDEDGDSSNSLRRALSHAEYRELWRTARWPLLVVVDLCGRNGLRPSEARALRWDRIDFDQMTLTINRQMSSSNEPTQAKTKRSIRTIPIDDRTVQALSTWKLKQDDKRERAGERWADNGLVVSTRYGTGIAAANLRRMVSTAANEAGIGHVVPYELRHTAITFQIDAGRDVWQVADWAGTSERMIEEVYRHRLTKVVPIGAAPVDLADE
jgi:integrase